MHASIVRSGRGTSNAAAVATGDVPESQRQSPSQYGSAGEEPPDGDADHDRSHEAEKRDDKPGRHKRTASISLRDENPPPTEALGSVSRGSGWCIGSDVGPDLLDHDRERQGAEDSKRGCLDDLVQVEVHTSAAAERAVAAHDLVSRHAIQIALRIRAVAGAGLRRMPVTRACMAASVPLEERLDAAVEPSRT